MTSFLKLSKKEEVSSKKTNSTANKSEESKKQLAKVRFSLWRFLLNWTNILQSKHKMSNEIQYAPLRTLDDFILSSARFQLPNFSDFEKWGNRVVKNLCYYQSNYGVMVLIWLLIVLLIQPKALLGAASILTVSIFAIRYCLATYGSTTNAMENVKLMLYITLPCVLALYLLELLIFGLFVFLVPFCCKNKIVKLVSKKTT